MGLPEQDDTPPPTPHPRHNSGAAAWEGRWRGPPWGLLVRSSACPQSPPANLKGHLALMDVQVVEGGLTVLPTSDKPLL